MKMFSINKCKKQHEEKIEKAREWDNSRPSSAILSSEDMLNLKGTGYNYFRDLVFPYVLSPEYGMEEGEFFRLNGFVDSDFVFWFLTQTREDGFVKLIKAIKQSNFDIQNGDSIEISKKDNEWVISPHTSRKGRDNDSPEIFNK